MDNLASELICVGVHQDYPNTHAPHKKSNYQSITNFLRHLFEKKIQGESK